MSQTVNSELFERASIVSDYFEGKLPAQVIEKDLERNDLEQLELHIYEAEAIMSQEYYHAMDMLGDNDSY